MVRHRDPLVVGGVVGDVLDPFSPSIGLRIVYGRNLTNGCGLKPSQVVQPPRVDVGGDDLRTFYTLVRSLKSQSTPIFQIIVALTLIKIQ